ncbi:hypothetical protein LY78DRAFT_681525 [Colletotrichum sublineola]|nr:hypothetical protein LY78DRAFT_681525 [Colletotrichum sublineola]
MQDLITGDLEGLVMDSLLRGLEITPEEAMAFCATARKRLGDTKDHLYFHLHHVVGRKPNPEGKGGPYPVAEKAEHGTQTLEESPETPVNVVAARKRKADSDKDRK